MKKGMRRAKTNVKGWLDTLSREGPRSRSQSLAAQDLDPGVAASVPQSPQARGKLAQEVIISASLAVEPITAAQPLQIAGLPPSPSPSLPLDPYQIQSSQSGKHDCKSSQVDTTTVVDIAHTSSKITHPPSNVMQDPCQAIYNNNQNTILNYGRDVTNNNLVTNHIYLTKEEKNIIKAIRTAIGSRFVAEALHQTQPEDAGCMPGTRVRVLSMFLEWAKHNPMLIFWLAGLAGTGKTSIAVTLCRMLQNEPSVLFGGSFFCSRTANISGLTDARCIIPTLAASLAAQSREFAAALKEELDADLIAASKPISAQIIALLQRPLAALNSSARPIVFVVDALDECSDENQVKRLLEAISALTCEATVKFIVTSRPETHISASPVSSSDHNTILRLHTVDREEVEEDIRMYIDDAFSRKPLDDQWYTESDVSSLAAHADGLFIFASTVVTYVLDIESVDGRAARLQKATNAIKSSKVATGPLDTVYEFVIMRAFDTTKVEEEELDATRQTLACILTARVPLSTVALAEILGWKSDVLHASLRRLRAVVHVPEMADEPGLRTVHASFGDYLLERATVDFRISRMLGNEAFTRGSLRVMKERLYFNISQSQSSHARNLSTSPGEFSQSSSTYPSHEPSSSYPSDSLYEPSSLIKPDDLTLSVEYACLQWVYHLADLQQPDGMDGHVWESFCSGFLFWLEVMSVLNQVQRAAAMLHIATSMVRSHELSVFFRDANAFVASSREAIERSAPHIYISALPFAGKDSHIYRRFTPLCTGLIAVDTVGIHHHGGRLVTTLVGHTAWVVSVAYAPDGRLISGSTDGTVYIWDTRTGGGTTLCSSGDDDGISLIAIDPMGQSLVSVNLSRNIYIWSLQSPRQPSRRFSGHSRSISCISFSPNGRLIASASMDKTVGLWMIETGELLSKISDHTDEVNAVAFSPDGQILVSGSEDKTVRLWNGLTGKHVGRSPLEHDAHVFSLCISPDGAKLAVGLHDTTIILRDFSTMKVLATLRGHRCGVLSVQFSPDGRSLLSTSDDETARLWSLQKGVNNISSIVICRHPSNIETIAFSPDSLYIASAGTMSNDVCIWDAGSSRQMAQPCEAHSNPLRSVVASADGAVILSNSDDGSARVWDAKTGEPAYALQTRHAGEAFSTAISPDSRLIAAGWLDGIIDVWDLSTGEKIGQKPHEGIDRLGEGTLSSDAQLLALRCDDGTIRVWDVATGSSLPTGPLHCDSRVLSVAFSFDSQIVAAGSENGTIHLWNINTGIRACKPIQLRERSGSSFPIAFSHTDTRMACSKGSNIGYIWDVATGQKVITFGVESLDSEVTSIAFSPDDFLIGCGTDDFTVQLWNAATGAQLALLYGHIGPVSTITFTANGQSIISGSEDSTIRVWNVAAAQAWSSDNGNDLAAILESTGLEDGWLLGESGELLLWIPPDYRANIELPSCRLLIASHRVAITASETWHHGEDWTSCWLGAPSM